MRWYLGAIITRRASPADTYARIRHLQNCGFRRRRPDTPGSRAPAKPRRAMAYYRLTDVFLAGGARELAASLGGGIDEDSMRN